MAASEGKKTEFLRYKCLTADNWSLYPATSDVNMACHSLTSVSNISFCDTGIEIKDTASSINVSGLVVFDQPPQTPIAPTAGDDLANKTYVDPPPIDEWYQHPAIQEVNMNCNDISGAGSVRFCEGDSSITATATSFDISSNSGITISSDVSTNFLINSGSTTRPLSIQSAGIQPTGVFDASGSLGNTSDNLLTSTGSLVLWRSLAAIRKTGMTAIGGDSKTTFISNGIEYTAHVFTNTSVIHTFSITNLGTEPQPTMDVLIVGGGGAGGSSNVVGGNGGGGGAGAVMILQDISLIPYNNTRPYAPAPPPYVFGAIRVGIGGTATINGRGGNGTESGIIFPTTLRISNYASGIIFAPTTYRLISPGGGGGGGGAAGSTSAGNAGVSGYTGFIAGANIANSDSSGSGGGGAGGTGAAASGGTATFHTNDGFGDIQGISYTGGGRIGGSGTSAGAGAGGGGARGQGLGTGSAGLAATVCSPGGGGLRTNFDGTNRAIGGGGQGAGESRSILLGNAYGGGLGYASIGALAATAGAPNTGGGGGGAPQGQLPGAGGSGLIIIRYRS